jgi:DNA replication and repair protein RecF
MYLSHLSLTHFRNYQHLELDLHGRFTLLQGQNAQGKTNLLEAIFFLATSKPIHAQTEREVVDWRATEEPIPYSRLAGRVQREDGALDLEIILTPRGDGVNFTKQVKINGVARRSMELVGQLRAVLFLPEDVKLVDGAPGERRRYLDIALCQLDRTYCRALSHYQKVLAQRNSLLRGLSEQAPHPNGDSIEAQLSFWDDKLIDHGSYVIARRQQFTEQLNQIAQQRHAELSDGGETLTLHYLPSFNPGHLSDFDYAALTDERNAFWPEITTQPLDAAIVAKHYRARLHQRRRRELAAGTTLYGPHRDDLRFVANGRDLRSFGSRGQQRTAALALKLAEVQVSTETTGVTPLLLLDDVMSELDAARRHTLLATLSGVQQAVITTTDWEDFAPDFRAQAQRLHVQQGTVRPADV